MSNQEFRYMLECLKEASERLHVSANSIDEAISTVSSMEKRIEEYYLPCPAWGEPNLEDEYECSDKEA